MRVVLVASLLGVSLMAAAGCGPYSFREGGGKGGYKSIAVPLFENRTSEYGIRELLTEGVIDGFIKDGGLPVVNEKRADAVLRGAVTAYRRDAYTYDAGDRVKEYRVTISVSARLEDPAKRNVIWEDDALEQWGIFSADSESEEDGKARAVAKLSEDIVNRTVKGW
jgi:hypothetical protein